MLQLLRSLVFSLGYWLSIVFYGLLSLPLLLLPRAFAAKIIISWNQCVLSWLRITCGVKTSISGLGLEAIPATCVIVANHQSPWETFFFQYHLYPLSTILKKELLRIPFFGWGLRIMDPIAIDRSTPVQALKQIKKISLARLANNRRIIIFPEGTRMPLGHIGTYKRSAADIAKEAGVPLIPIAHTAGQHWLNKHLLKKPGKIKVHIGEAIDMTDKNTKEVMQAIEAWTKKTLAEVESAQSTSA